MLMAAFRSPRLEIDFFFFFFFFFLRFSFCRISLVKISHILPSLGFRSRRADPEADLVDYASDEDNVSDAEVEDKPKTK